MKIKIAKFSKQTQPINPDGAPHGSATGKSSGVAKGSAPGGEQQRGLQISSGQKAAPRKRRKDRRCRAPAACYQKEIGRKESWKKLQVYTYFGAMLYTHQAMEL